MLKKVSEKASKFVKNEIAEKIFNKTLKKSDKNINCPKRWRKKSFNFTFSNKTPRMHLKCVFFLSVLT